MNRNSNGKNASNANTSITARLGAPTDLTSEYLFVSDVNKLVLGFTIFEKKDRKKGKIIFSLDDLPIRVKYITELGNQLERINNNEVKFADKKIAIHPIEELLGERPKARTTITTDNITYEDSEETKQMITEGQGIAKESKIAMKRILKIADETDHVANAVIEKLDPTK